MPGYLSAYRRRKDNRLRERNSSPSTASSIERRRAIEIVNKEKAVKAQQTLAKVKSIFDSRTEQPTSANGIELQDWFAFGICLIASVLIIHFFVGWWTTFGLLILSLNGFLFYIELQQRRISLQALHINQRVPPSSIHGASILLQITLLLGYVWFPHWVSILVQIFVSFSAVFILHYLRNPAIETIFKKRQL
jgi:hypothetical protein